MKVQLVVADLDGSLVETGKPLSDQNKKAIEYLHSKGIKVGIASGRNLFDITRLPKRWNLDFDFDMYIGLNGSEVLDTAIVSPADRMRRDRAAALTMADARAPAAAKCSWSKPARESRA